MNHQELLERMKLLVNGLSPEVRESLQRAWNDDLPQVTSGEAQINKMQKILGEIDLALTAVGGMYHYYRLSRIPDDQIDITVLQQFARDYRYEQGLDRLAGEGTPGAQVNRLAQSWLELTRSAAA
ncbi:MAG: hypothetical protein JWO82_763 [Akkermansiaceae bacterium]|nr:hypothetical protein [Akkermansiaceae bacterium]